MWKRNVFFSGVTVLFYYLFFWYTMLFLFHVVYHTCFTFSILVWMEVMLPQLNVKQLTKFIVSYLETLLRWIKNCLIILSALLSGKDHLPGLGGSYWCVSGKIAAMSFLIIFLLWFVLLSSCNKSSNEVVKAKDFIAVMELAFSKDSSLAGNPR